MHSLKREFRTQFCLITLTVIGKQTSSQLFPILSLKLSFFAFQDVSTTSSSSPNFQPFKVFGVEGDNDSKLATLVSIPESISTGGDTAIQRPTSSSVMLSSTMSDISLPGPPQGN